MDSGVPLLPVGARETNPSTTTMRHGPENLPPFQQSAAIFDSQDNRLPPKPKLCLPAHFASRSSTGGRTGLTGINAKDRVILHEFFSQSLSVQRLNIIHKHLWIAGLPRHAQPLHQHILRKRDIVITERADHHLLWSNEELLLMPLPAYLLDYDIWQEHLCTDRELFTAANGFLLSYICLICSESDFRIAREQHLIPSEVTWATWTAFVQSSLQRLPLDSSKDVNPRYLYGELRLGRVNWIYRFCSKTRSFTTMMRGYSYGYTSYGSFFSRNTTWVVAATVYITVVLTALQVGLGTKELADDAAFSRVSYGFTVFSIAAPLGVLALVVMLMMILVPFNAFYAMKQRRRATIRMDSLGLRSH